MDIIQLISAAGVGGIIGSTITTFIQSWLSTKSRLEERKYNEKKSAYMNFLKSVYDHEITPTKENVMHVAHWIAVCEIVGTKEIKFLMTEELRRTSPADGKEHPERQKIIENIKDAIKKDLGF